MGHVNTWAGLAAEYETMTKFSWIPAEVFSAKQRHYIRETKRMGI